VKYLLDTNACIGWLRNNEPKLVARMHIEDPANLVSCSIVVGELLYGAERSGPAYQAANLLRVRELRSRLHSLSFDDQAAEQYGRVRAILAGTGQLVGPNDLMIAAIALSHGLTLVTHNTSEFSRIPGLVIEDWQ
jgi:tRNA(fMet)-specific endonuclease VapC